MRICAKCKRNEDETTFRDKQPSYCVECWSDYRKKWRSDPPYLIKSRAEAEWDRRKIAMGSTPTIKGRSHIEKQFLRGNQQHYLTMIYLWT